VVPKREGRRDLRRKGRGIRETNFTKVEDVILRDKALKLWLDELVEKGSLT